MGIERSRKREGYGDREREKGCERKRKAEREKVILINRKGHTEREQGNGDRARER